MGGLPGSGDGALASLPGSASDQLLAGGVAGRLLIEAGSVLASSLDVAATMQQVAGLAVPGLADLCVIDRCREDGSITGVAVAAARTGVAGDLERLRARYPLDPAGDHPVARVIRSGKPELLVAMSNEQLRSFARSPEHATFMTAHDYRTGVIAPLIARGRVLGALSVLRLGQSVLSYTPDDLALVVELARRAALAIDNARLYTDLRRAEGRLETVFASVSEAITVIDTDGRIVLANQAAAALLGYPTPDQLTSADPATIRSRVLGRDEQGQNITLAAVPGRRLLEGEDAQPLLIHHLASTTGEERWLIVRSSPVPDPDTGEVLYAVNVFENITELKRVELGEKFMAEASTLLASSMDYEATLPRIARLAIPHLADWIAIDLRDKHGQLNRIAFQHTADPEIERAGIAVSATKGPVAEVIATGRTHINQAFQAEPAVTLAAAPSGREPSSSAAAATVMVLPILGATGPIGAVTVLSASQRGRSAQTDVALLERLARRIGTAVENARLYAERLEIGHTLQRALLPATLPAIDGLELQARFLPASGEVGGDFYDVIHRHPDRWILAIGDVCGKGARAAAVTALARHTLRAAAISGQPPTQMLETLHEALRCHSPVFELCTVCLVVVELTGARAQLTIALAGHPRPLIINRARHAQPHGVPGTLLGAPGPIRPGLATVSLEPGETLLLYTDGVLDAGRPDNRLDDHGLIEACRHPTPTLAELLQHIERIALDRAAGKPRDDLALLALRHTPSPTATPTKAPAA